jgi:hypothetical protein
VFIQLPGVTQPHFLLADGVYVGQVIDAIISKFKLNATPQQLLLFKLGDHPSRVSLDPTQTLCEAGVQAGSKLAVEVAATQDPVVRAGVCWGLGGRLLALASAMYELWRFN